MFVLKTCNFLLFTDGRGRAHYSLLRDKLEAACKNNILQTSSKFILPHAYIMHFTEYSFRLLELCCVKINLIHYRISTEDFLTDCSGGCAGIRLWALDNIFC